MSIPLFLSEVFMRIYEPKNVNVMRYNRFLGVFG